MKEGLKAGREEGLKEGHKKAIIEMAKSMKTKGLPTSTIAELTGLSEQEINSI